MQTILEMEPVEGPTPKRPRGRAWRIVAVVLALHAVALGGFVVFQGCNRSETPPRAEDNAPPPIVPEGAAPATDAVQAGAVTAPPIAQPGSMALTPEERVPGQGEPPPSTPAVPADVAFAPPPSVPANPAEGAPPKAAKPAKAGSNYAVRKGDTLSRIARHYSVSVRELADMNRMSADASLKVGQKLAVPTPKTAVGATSRGAAVPKAGAVKTTATTHAVKAGETLTSIAKKHGVTTDALMRANDITDPTKLKVGQKLKIPAGRGAATPSNTSSDPLHKSRRLAA